MLRVEKPWGSELIWARSNRIAGKILTINAGERLSLQFHERKEEAIYVLSGQLTLVTRTAPEAEDERTLLSPGESFHVYPGDIHRFEASDGEVVLVEVSTPELEDVFRLEDDYDRGRGEKGIRR